MTAVEGGVGMTHNFLQDIFPQCLALGSTQSCWATRERYNYDKWFYLVPNPP